MVLPNKLWHNKIVILQLFALVLLPLALFAETTSDDAGSTAPFESTRPALRPADLAERYRAHDCGLPNCSRTDILNRKGGGSCANHVLDMACRYSPWAEKTLEERYYEIRKQIEKYNRLHGWNVDPNAMLCIFAKEGAGLEPLILNFGSCSSPGKATDTGLGQVIATTAGDMLCRKTIRFRSKHPAFSNFSCNSSSEYRVGKPYIEKMLAYPDAQIEMSMRVLLDKTSGRGRNLTRSHFRNYNGNKDYKNGRQMRDIYADSVFYSCYQKIQGASPERAFAVLKGYKPLVAQYNDIQSRCQRIAPKQSVRPKQPPVDVSDPFRNGGFQ